MNIKTEDFIQRGYFPKELPPPFNTFSFADIYPKVKEEWKKIKQEYKDNKKINEFNEKYAKSECLQYSIAKGTLSRRYIKIPNPIHFSNVVEDIIESWDSINRIISESVFSKSKPVINQIITQRIIKPNSSGLSEFTKATLAASIDKKVQLKLDISKFYPTIYTHSISWALLGKETAKKIYNYTKEEKQEKKNDESFKLYQKADNLDRSIRKCQDNQTIGIPIGPDSSFVIAELINARIDIVLHKQFPNVTGCRYYDDYYLYTNSVIEAEQILKFLQEAYFEFGLDINESKVSIKKYPFEFLKDFDIELTGINFKENFEHSLIVYFNALWHYANIYPDQVGKIFRFGLKVFTNKVIKIQNKYWSIFEDLLFKTVLIDPTIQPEMCQILLQYKENINETTKEKLKRIIDIILEDHIALQQHLEMSWALWISKIFQLEISETNCLQTLKVRDNISCLILLDLYKNTSCIQNTDKINEEFEKFRNSFSDLSLMNEDWLLTYEAIHRKWINRPEIIESNEYFKILDKYNVSFYDTNDNVDFTSIEYLLSLNYINQDLKDFINSKSEEIYKKIKEMREAQISFDNDLLIGDTEAEEQAIKEIEYLDIKSEISKYIVSKIIQLDHNYKSLDTNKCVQKIWDDLQANLAHS